MRNIIIKKKCLLFKHEKNNQTLSNDWPTYCHTGIRYFYKIYYWLNCKYMVSSRRCIVVIIDGALYDVRGCSGSQKVGASKIARCHFQEPVKNFTRSQFFEPKLWWLHVPGMFSFMYKWSRFVCTNVNVYCTSVFHFDFIIKNKKIYIIYYNKQSINNNIDIII